MSRIHYIIFIFNLVIILLVENVKCRRPRIHHAMQADDSFKYVVKLERADYEIINGTIEKTSELLCTGSFVTNQHIITAAHCVIQDDGNSLAPGEYWVFSGTIDLLDSTGTWSYVKKIYVPSYYRSIYDYRYVGDIAVLELEQPLPIDQILLVALPQPSEEPLSGIRGRVAGYGLYSNMQFEDVEEYDSQCILRKERVLRGELPRFLQYAEAEVISHNECVNIHNSNGDVITKHHLCARMVSVNKNDTYRGVCMGDSGGPLVIGYVQVGVVSRSYDSGCNENRRPEIYTKVSHFVNFIKNAMYGNIDDSCANTHIPRTTMQIIEDSKKEIESSMNQCLVT